MSSQPPQDPQELRAEIAQTRSELGNTVEALAAKTDVKARAQDAVADVKDRVTEQAKQVAGTVQEQTGAAVAAVRRTVRDTDVPALARRPMPWAVLGAGIGLIAVAVYVVRKTRS